MMKTWQQLLAAGTVLCVVAESQCTPGIHNGFTDNPDLAVAVKGDLAANTSADFALAEFPDMAVIPLALTAISPALGPSTGGTSLTFTGTHFVNGVTVTIGGNPATVTQQTATQLTVTLPAAPLTKGPASVVVRNLDGMQVTRGDLFSYYYGTVAFMAENPIPVGRQPFAVAIGKMDGGNTLDLVVANFLDDKVGVLLGDGKGGFATMVAYPTGTRPKGVALADFNNDLYLDVVSANFTGPSVSVLLNDKSGKLLAKTDSATGAGPSAVAARDVNNDSYADVVTANASGGTASYFLSKAGGGLPMPQSLTASSGPSAVTMADVDGDAVPDIVIANKSTGDCTVYLGDGKGGFKTPTPRGTYYAGKGPVSLAVADIDGDGKVDLVVSLEQDNAVGVMKGNGDGFFNDAKLYTVGTQPAGVAVADFNGDGKPDVASVANVDGTVTLLLNVNGVPATRVSLVTSDLPLGIAVGDLDGDSRPDIVVTNSGAASLSVFLNTSQ